MPARIFGFRISLIYCFLFLGMGVQLPFLPLWLQFKGMSDAEIAVVMAAMIAVRIIGAPIGTFIADRTADRRRVIAWSAALSFAAYCLMSTADGFWPILLAGLAGQACFSPIVPLCEGLALDGSQRHDLDYGRLRLWGSLSFVGASLGAGALLAHLPVSAVVFMIAMGQGLLALASFALPQEPAGQPIVGARLSPRAAARLLAAPAFVLFLLASGLGQASHGLLYTFGSVHWHGQGYGEPAIGLLWGISIAAEITLFFYSNRVVKRLGPVNLFAIGAAAGLVRWAVMAGDPALAPLIVCQALHALSFGAIHLGAMHYLQRSVPASLRNTAQGLYSAAAGGVAMSAVMLASGPLYAAFAGQAYLAMAVMAAAALALALQMRRISPTAPAEQAA